MQTWRYGILLSLAVIVTAVLYWYGGPRTVHTISDEDRSMNELRAEVMRYRTEAKDWRTKSEIAKNVASSQTHLWEKCSRGIGTVHPHALEALSHFASAYLQRGPQQKEELIALLHSQDVELVGDLLYLLTNCCDLGPNGEWQVNKGPGGSEIVPHIAQVYKAHPTLAVSVARTLGDYGSASKGEIPTLLRIALSQEQREVFAAKVALQGIDFDGVYSQFGLEPLLAPLTDKQRAEIEAYLKDHGEK